jgi:hypothetical protein
VKLTNEHARGGGRRAGAIDRTGGKFGDGAAAALSQVTTREGDGGGGATGRAVDDVARGREGVAGCDGDMATGIIADGAPLGQVAPVTLMVPVLVMAPPPVTVAVPAGIVDLPWWR